MRQTIETQRTETQRNHNGDFLWWSASLLGVFTLCFALLLPMTHAYFRNDDFAGMAALQHPDHSVWRSFAGVTVLWNIVAVAVHHFAGIEAAPYYWLIISLHALASCAVLWTTFQLTHDRLVALVTSLCFAVLWHHHEAATWIATGFRPLAMIFVLFCLGSFARYRRTEKNLWLGSAMLFLLAALLTKEDALPLIIMLFLADRWMLKPKQSWRDSLHSVAPFVLIYIFYFVVRWALRDPKAYLYTSGAGEPIFQLGPHILSNLILCVPQMLAPDLGFTTYQAMLARLGFGPSSLSVFHSASMVAQSTLSALAVFAIWRGNSQIKFSIVWCYVLFLSCTPFLYFFARTPRYLYVSSFGLCLLAGLGFAALWQRCRTRAAQSTLCAALVVVLTLNAAFIRLVTKNRVRDSILTRSIINGTLQVVPRPAAKARIYLLGVPDHVKELTTGVEFHYSVPVQCKTASAAPAAGWPADSYVVQFAPGAAANSLQPKLLHSPRARHSALKRARARV